MSSMYNNDFGDNIKDLQDNHVPCLLLIDTSGSMANGGKIDSVNEGINVFIDQLNADNRARNTVDFAIVTFDSEINIVQEFMPASSVTEIPILTASGATKMGAGLEVAIDMVNDRLKMYKDMGVGSYIPWIVLFTDGEPTDDISVAKQKLDAENAKSKSGRGRIQLWTLGVKGANVDVLQSLTHRNLWVTDKDYTKIFDWTRKSLAIVSTTTPGDRPELDDLSDAGAQVNIPVDFL